jgi:hypothetical protein
MNYNKFQEFATYLEAEGFNPLPLKKSKAPMLPVGHSYLYDKVSYEDIDTLFANAEGIGIACGEVSEGFYCIDFDCHKGGEQVDIVKAVFDDFYNTTLVQQMIEQEECSIFKTPKQGFHFYFRTNNDLKRPAQKLAKYKDGGGTMIEVRGHGSYVAVFPSDGYTKVAGADVIGLRKTDISIDTIFNFCKTYSQVQEEIVHGVTNEKKKWGDKWKDTTPEGKYNLECHNEALEMLSEAGWQYAMNRPTDGVQYWVRPGKNINEGHSATFGYQKNMFFIFTQDDGVAPFDPMKGYSPFNILTLLKYEGDWKRAKAELKKRFGMEEPEDEFWSVNETGRYSLNNFKFKTFLEKNNYFKFTANQKSTFEFVQKEGIFLKIVYEKDIKDFVLDYVLALEKDYKESVYNLMAGGLKYFKREFLSMLQTKVINTMKDDAKTCYLYYRNKIVKVTADEIQTIEYEDVDLNIWKNQVIDRDYTQTDHHNSEYRTFIWLISGKNKEKYKAFQSVIGYLMHSYKSNSNNKAIIFNDEIISETPNGRSGKGLFWNALKRLKNVNSLDGKTFDFNKSFPYQSVSTDCQILVFDDVKKNFNFENLFSVITEGITIEYKGQDSIKLEVTESPKIIITTNYTVKGEGASFVDRMYEVEMSSYFNENHTPIHEFGHELFNDWNEAEWARFDMYMIECVKVYLKNGLIPMPTVNLKQRKLINDLGQELINFCESLPKDVDFIVRDLFISFKEMYPELKFITQNKITTGLKAFCKYKGYDFKNVTRGGIAKFMILSGEKSNEPTNDQGSLF